MANLGPLYLGGVQCNSTFCRSSTLDLLVLGATTSYWTPTTLFMMVLHGTSIPGM